MASRSTLKTWIRQWLGTSADDPAFADALLNPSLQSAYDGLVAEIQDVNPGYLVSTATLAADSSTSHVYTFATQASALTDFAKWLQLRYTNEDGAGLDECRYDELTGAGPGFFAIRGTDTGAALVTSPDTEAGVALWLQYGTWPAEMDDDADEPSAIPSRFHDVVALECLFVFGIGGEQTLPAELNRRWLMRRSQLLSRVGRRGVSPSRTRLVEPVVL